MNDQLLIDRLEQAVIEQLRERMKEAVSDIADVNKPDDKVRTIHIEISILPVGRKRDISSISIGSSSKLAKPIETELGLSYHSDKNGVITVQMEDPNQYTMEFEKKAAEAGKDEK